MVAMKSRTVDLVCLLLLSLLALPGCARMARLEASVEKLQLDLARMRQQHEEDLKELRDIITFGDAKLWARIECNNHEVREFISACQTEGDLGCTPEAMNVAMSFMATQPYVSMYLRPGDPLVDLAHLRRGQVAVLTDPQLQHPSTKFLILVQPRSESAAHAQEAHNLGYLVSRMLRERFGVFKTVKIIGPRALPCKLKQEQLKSYMRRWDFAVEGEPKEKEPRVRVFVFRTDC
jgi:hypothetical protein